MISKISKIIITLIIALAVVTCMCTSVFAADDEEPIDLSGSILGGSGNTPEDPEPELEPDPETTPQPEDPEPETNPDPEPEPETNESEEDNKKTYEESIPYAGPADTVLMVVAFLTLGGIGIYTFIKLSEYSNI